MVSIEAQQIQADKDAAARQKARDIFLSTGGTEEQLKVFEFQKLINQHGFGLARLRAQGKPDTNRSVRFFLIQILSLELAIAKLKGEQVSRSTLTKVSTF